MVDLISRFKESQGNKRGRQGGREGEREIDRYPKLMKEVVHFSPASSDEDLSPSRCNQPARTIALYLSKGRIM